MKKVIKDVGNISIKQKERKFEVDILEITPEGFHRWIGPIEVDTIHILEPFKTRGILADGNIIQVFVPQGTAGCKIEETEGIRRLVCAQGDRLKELLE